MSRFGKRDGVSKSLPPYDGRFVHPRYWGIWLAVGFLRLTSLLPYAGRVMLGGAICRGLYPIMQRRRRIGRTNLELRFPEMPETAREKRFAKLSVAPVVPFYFHRLPGFRGYELVVHPPLGNYPSGDPAADARTQNAVLEEAIRRTPDQYLWVHGRFKTRQDGEPDVYTR